MAEHDFDYEDVGGTDDTQFDLWQVQQTAGIEKSSAKFPKETLL